LELTAEHDSIQGFRKFQPLTASGVGHCTTALGTQGRELCTTALVPLSLWPRGLTTVLFWNDCPQSPTLRKSGGRRGCRHCKRARLSAQPGLWAAPCCRGGLPAGEEPAPHRGPHLRKKNSPSSLSLLLPRMHSRIRNVQM